MDVKHHLRHPRVSETWDQRIWHRTRGDEYNSGAAVGSWVEYATAPQAIQDTYAQAIQSHLHSTGPKSQALSEVNGERHTSLQSDSPHLSQTPLTDWEMKGSTEISTCRYATVRCLGVLKISN